MKYSNLSWPLEGEPIASHAIILEVLRPSPAICFIATPYADEFRDLCLKIVAAANHFAFTALQTRDLPLGDGFHDKTYDLIRAATLVVVVCTPERGTSGES